MSFRKPITTLKGLVWWKNIRQSPQFLLQEHRTGLWPYRYRILMRENSMEIANANDRAEIEIDWKYLKDHEVPQLDRKIDVGELLRSLIERV